MGCILKAPVPARESPLYEELAPGSTPGTVLRNATIEYAKITAAAIEQLTADSIAAMTAKIQEIVSHNLITD